MNSKDDIINYIVKRKIFSTEELKKIEENDIAYLANKLSARKIKINYNEFNVKNEISEDELKCFIEKTNPYISSDRDLTKYKKKANLIQELKNGLISYYKKIKSPYYYLIINSKDGSFICPSDVPEYLLDDKITDLNTRAKPLICWDIKYAEKIYDFIIRPYEKMGIKHFYFIKAFNAQNEILD